MITSINEYRSINEVRLPHGYFKITGTFNLDDGTGWDIIFNKDNIVEIDTENKKVKRWSRLFNSTTNANNGDWTSTDFSYNKLMLPDFYKEFKVNSIKLSAEETPEFVKNKVKTQEFTTTVKRFNNKATQSGLTDDTKVKVIVIK